MDEKTIVKQTTGQQVTKTSLSKDTIPIVKPIKPKITIKYDALRPKLTSQSALIYDLTNQELVFSQNAQSVSSIASLAKIMTAMLAIEKLDLEQKITIDTQTLNLMRQYQASTAGFLAGESVSVRDLLHGLILASGGESGYVLAREISGDQTTFAAFMNQRAKELGAEKTHFANSIGLDNQLQYSTAEDVLKILKEALKNPIFRQIFTTEQYQATSLNRELLIKSTLFSKLDTKIINGFEILGAKTGTTGQAGLCLAVLVSRNGHELLIITLGAPLDNLAKPTPHHINDLQIILHNLL
ncbi:MAG: serine hydrolase [Candidatus Saccharibacteria bacterium]|nr:serine hydrolase [Candidatus Saccharibacteria bacterium]